MLPAAEREPVLGDMMEANESAWQALWGLGGLMLRRHTEAWRNWRPWLAGFGVALPNSFLLMGVSLSVSWSYMRLLCPDLLAQAALTKPSAIAVLLWQALLLIGAAWTGGFVVGSHFEANAVGEHAALLFTVPDLPVASITLTSCRDIAFFYFWCRRSGECIAVCAFRK